MNSTFLFAMLLTTLAGLSTTLGSVISIFYRKPSQGYMAFTIGFSAAIALHNIPEGIAVSVPVYAVTGSVRKAFLWSFLSGISEPIGALIAGIILMPFLNETVIGWMLSAVGGFMVFIAFDELLPVSQSYKKEHISIIGVMVGMIVMSFSLALF